MAGQKIFEKITICGKRCSKTENGDPCCIAKIYHLLEVDAKEVKEMEEGNFAETPLHKAAAAGNTEVALEILSLMPSLGGKLNSGGWSPLHLAIKGAHHETAISMARFDKMLVRVKGKKGMTPLMLCAARSGKEEEEHGVHNEERSLLAKLLLACPESVSDRNNKNQTMVHVALENRGCKTVCMLVDWLKRRNQITSVLSVKQGRLWGQATQATARGPGWTGAQNFFALYNTHNHSGPHDRRGRGPPDQHHHPRASRPPHVRAAPLPGNTHREKAPKDEGQALRARLQARVRALLHPHGQAGRA